MSTIKDFTIRVNNKPVTTTVIIYTDKTDTEYSIPEEDNNGNSLESEEREFIREAIEFKISNMKVEDHYDDYSDELEDENLEEYS